jgi:hypothetical protein
MADNNKIPVVIRTQVYLNDPDYFCNKSWTMSYNLNTKSWISYHTYIPNFYIGENNFFYSGLNGCCDDVDAGGFQAIAGVLNKQTPSTTTTTTFYPSPTTTSTTTVLDCTLVGIGITTSCELVGTGIITVPPTTTTTICQRPSSLISNTFGIGYKIGTEPEIISFNNFIDSCNAVSVLSLRPTGVTPIGFSVQAVSYEDGQIIYVDSTLTDCVFVEDGWYFTEEGVYNSFVYNIENGVIKEISDCNCDATTSTTTTAPIIDNCCTALVSSGTNIYYHNLGQPMGLLNIPNYTAGIAIAVTRNYLWSVDTQFHQWDITLLPFNATYNRDIAFPMGFTTASGMTALNDETLITINDSASPQAVTEINITDVIGVDTYIFDLQTDRIAIGNLLLTSNSKLLLINQDSTTSDYYLTQYDYPLGTIEYDIQITTITPTNLYECNCWLFIVDELGVSWLLDKTNPYDLLPAETFTYAPISITQVSSCFSAEIPLTTTTTTTIIPTTTTTTTV